MENRSIKELIKKVGQSFTKWETVCKKKNNASNGLLPRICIVNAWIYTP